MNKACGIARDLMPLCLDEAASEGSQEYVEKHMEECAKCAAYYAGMQAALPRKTEAEKRQEQAAFEQVARGIKKKQRRGALKKVLLGVLIGALALGGGLAGWGWISGRTEEMPADAYTVSAAQLTDGRVVFSVDYHGSKEQSLIQVREIGPADSRALLIVGERYRPIARSLSTPMQNSYVLVESLASLDKLDGVFQGSGPEKGQQVVWLPGVEIPAASPEMEEYFYWTGLQDELVARRYAATSAGKMLPVSRNAGYAYTILEDHCLYLMSLVPEWQPWTSLKTVDVSAEELSLALTVMTEAQPSVQQVLPTPLPLSGAPTQAPPTTPAPSPRNDE